MDAIPISDLELLQRFAKKGDQRAFEVIVARYANLVFGVALRRGVGRQGAEDVTQKVFAVLARKAKKLRRKATLAGWLSRTASLEAAYVRRSESNRQRKMDNYQNSGDLPIAVDLQTEDDALWRAALPHLDDVMSDLAPGDQDVILQRFYNEQSFAAIAILMNKSEAAVQKQSRRALDKMSKLLQRRGVVVPAAALATCLGSELAKAAPITAFSALSQGAITAAPNIAGAALLTNTLETMAYAKTKTALIVAAVAAIPTGMQWSKINQLESDLEERPAAVAATSGTKPNADLAALQQEVADLKAQLASATTAKSGPVSALAKNSTGTEESSSAGALSGLADMFEDPAMRELIKAQMKGQVDMMYGEFIEDLGVDKAKRADLHALLLERQMDMASLGMKAMRKGVSPEDKEAAGEALQLARDTSDDTIKDLIGDDAFEDFQRYEDSTGERTELTAFKQSLTRSEAADLTFEQEEKLMAIMYEERKAYKFNSDFDPTGQSVPEWEATEDKVKEISADYRGLQTQIAARAGEVLDEKQIGVFVNNQDSFHKMMQASLQMSVKMLGGEPTTEGE